MNSKPDCDLQVLKAFCHLMKVPVANITFNQVAFHTLFFADYYLGRDKHVTEQAFHREHPEFFRDYEELLPRVQTHTYDRPTMRQYLRTTAGRRPSSRSPLKPPSHWASPMSSHATQ